MRSQVIHIIHKFKLFITFRALSSWPKFIHLIHSLVLFITSRSFYSWLRIVHIIHIPELFIESRALSSWLGVVYVIHRLEIFKPSRALNSWPRVLNVIHDPELFIASRALLMRAWLTNGMHVLFKFQLVRLQGLKLKKFKKTLNGLIHNIWAEVNSWRPKEDTPHVPQGWISMIQALE